MTILPEKHIQEFKDHRNTKNKSEMYEKQKQSKELEEQKKLGYEVGRLQVKHDNDLWNQEIEKIKKEFIELINEGGK